MTTAHRDTELVLSGTESDDNGEEKIIDESDGTQSEVSSSARRRNLVGFWILGLCNNFAYVIMLSAAHDILSVQEGHQANSSSATTTTTVSPISNRTRECNPTSTGAILLADVLPTLLIKLTVPWVMDRIPIWIRVSVVVFFSMSSFLVVSLSVSVAMSLFGVVCASISSGFGEPTFLSLTHFFDKDVVSTWSSGTGGAGLFGALSYAGLTSVGISPRNTLLIMLVIPVLLAISYWLILVHPKSASRKCHDPADQTPLLQGATIPPVTFHQKLSLILPLMKFMLPLVVVYFAEYFINQGLTELLHFRNISWLSLAQQYRWYQVTYQLGVFISRSSVNFLPIRRIWILALLQCGNLVFFIIEAYFLFLPSIWIVLALILFEGLLGGSGYVNTFYRLRAETPVEHREYSLTFASLADTTGISVAGLIALPVHDYLCKTPIP